ncbi:MAG: 2-C-methyl-D-erythritol 4-phosphate cytidylyltransferase [Bacteroidales bacterium]|nr:2-C-methyl-D-erythritol 4-phosphate cytidylyltransferase [Bacteroidales bacterium]
MKRYAIILAGGIGSRMGTETPKQFLCVANKPILIHTLERFYDFDKTLKIIVVLPYEQRETWNELLNQYRCRIPHETVVGGNERFFSAQAGIIRAKRTAEAGDLIAIHDGVRMLVSKETIERCYNTAAEHGTAIACMPCIDSLRQCYSETENHAVDRTQFVTIQTPQTFQAELIIESYKQPYKPTFTDDASVVENAGFPIHLVEGNIENIKITTPTDLMTAEAVMKKGRRNKKQ